MAGLLEGVPAIFVIGRRLELRLLRWNFADIAAPARQLREFEEVPFWNDLDYIGVQDYFPLASAKEPGLDVLENGWKQPVARIEKIFKKFRKPVLFTELGYKSTPDVAIEPWRWPERQEVVSLETQANCYTAFFNKVWPLE